VKEYDILIGRDGQVCEALPGQEHVAVYARSRSGKTSDFAIPNALLWGGSLVVFDVKEEIYERTAGHRESLGQQIVALNPSSKRTHLWNPLSQVDRSSDERFDQIRRISFSLWPDATATSAAPSNADRFWEPKARSAFEGVCTIVAETPGEPFDMTNVLSFFVSPEANARLVRMVEDRRASGAKPYSLAAVQRVADFVRGHHEQVEGIRTTVTGKLEPWFLPHIQAATTKSDFDLSQLRRRPMSIYLTIAPAAIPRYRGYLILFFQQLLALNTDTLPEHDPTVQYQTLLLLDEFLRLGRAVELAEAGQYLAGYGIRMALIVQDKPQLAARYGEDAMQDIFSNVGAECIFGVNDLKTTRELSERIGFSTVPIASENKPRWWGSWQWNRQTTSTSPRQRAEMLPQEIARMSADEMIVLRAGMKPMRYKRVRWFENETLRRLVKPPPQIPELRVTVPLDDGSIPLRPPGQKKTGAKRGRPPKNANGAAATGTPSSAAKP
jgi:type IV secretion system protein VirD4